MKNNTSSMEHKHFVDTAIVELLKGGLVKEMSNRPHVLNPLTVSNNGEGKERLILDLRFAVFFIFYLLGSMLLIFLIYLFVYCVLLVSILCLVCPILPVVLTFI